MKQRYLLAQGTTEYALILSVVVLIALVVVTLFGDSLAAAFQKIFGGDQSTVNVVSTPGALTTPITTATPGATSTPVYGSIQEIATDFMQRTLAYYQANGKWPPTWGDARFTALGLDPADWSEPVNGILWNPNGSYIGISNASGDDLQVYAVDKQGKELHLYDGWDIWCHADDGNCYFHNMGNGREVALSSIVVR